MITHAIAQGLVAHHMPVLADQIPIPHPDAGGAATQKLNTGTETLTNNLVSWLYRLAGLGIAVSILAIVVTSWIHHSHGNQRAKVGLLVSAGSVVLLYTVINVANYVSGLFGGA